MTSASELFYIRRSRTGRNHDLGSASSLDRFPHHHHRQLEDCHPFSRRSSHGRPHASHLCRRISQTAECESVQLDHGVGPGSSNGVGMETSTNRTNQRRITRNDQLPAAVLQARARLLERLRGVSTTGNRQHRAASGISWDEFRVVDTSDWGAAALDWSTAVSPFTDTTIQGGPSSNSLETSKVKPPGLGRTVINSLRREVFNVAEGDGITRKTLECCICLESFHEGDGLICLPCKHRFHPDCLVPWVQACGDCPFCRTAIAVDCGKDQKF